MSKSVLALSIIYLKFWSFSNTKINLFYNRVYFFYMKFEVMALDVGDALFSVADEKDAGDEAWYAVDDAPRAPKLLTKL